jgi:dihydrolipoamide dehydrogenase
MTGDNKTDTVQAKNIIIATGSEPSPFPGLPFDEKIIVSSTGVLALPDIPKDLIVVGGGVIGLELGSVYTRLGSKVTVVEFLDQICPALDQEIAASLNKILSKQGMKILTSHKVLSGRVLGKGAEIVIEPVKGGDKQTLKADHILISTGRRPYIEGLGLKEIGVSLTNRGVVEVNDHFQTNVPYVYAIGDVIRGPMLAHKAEEEGIACVEIIAGKGGHVNYNAIPSVIYTHPEVASVGRTEE